MGPFLPARWLITSADSVDDPTIFPLLIGQSFLTGKAPIWSTAIATSSAGIERRQQRWSYPRWSIKVAYEVLRDRSDTPDLQKLWTFFNMHAGQAGEFGFIDPSDCMVSNAAFGIGDGIATTFRLSRTTTFGGITFTEPVFYVVGAPVVTVNGVEADVSVGENGRVTFTTPPTSGATLAWSGRFAFLVRFATDTLEAVQMMQALWSQFGLPLLSVKKS
jgi:uncharacterized protein (TIGR02217 family)